MGCKIEDFIGRFSETTDLKSYLPSGKNLAKIPRQFILDAFLYAFNIFKIIRTLDQEGFDAFVENAIRARTHREVDRKHDEVAITSEFRQKLDTTPLMSGMFYFYKFNSQKGENSPVAENYYKKAKN